MIKYAEAAVTFSEIPSEVSLTFSITNCPIHCPGCHSAYLWEDTGFSLANAIDYYLEKFTDLCTCVLFMGGDDEAQINELIDIIKHVRASGFKTALYSGFDEIKENLIPLLDYYKVGHYDEKLGGLDKSTTNQHLYKVESGILKDITKLLQKSWLFS